MRSRGLSFADAVKLLDGDSPEVAWLGQLAGVAAGTGREKVQGLSRFDRTDRLIAAHSVIVTVAFFEALDEWLADQGIELSKAKMTAAEQSALVAATLVSTSYNAMLDSLITSPPPFPSPLRSFEDMERDLSSHFSAVALPTLTFLKGLGAFNEVEIDHLPAEVILLAIRRYTGAFRRLAAEIPEFRLWIKVSDAQATRASVREAIGELRSSTAAFAGVRAGLAKRYDARLEKPILSSKDAPGDLVMPTLRQGYVAPTGTIAIAGRGDHPATESWWQGGLHKEDIPDFLLSALTSPAATDQPIVVLGHPGSGKSVLTRMLAAQLSTVDFLPVRVELRNVRADSPPQTQIEQARDYSGLCGRP